MVFVAEFGHAPRVRRRGGVSVKRHKSSLCDSLSSCLLVLFFRFNPSCVPVCLSLFASVCGACVTDVPTHDVGTRTLRKESA